jgi:hypothetical protein
MTQSHKFSANLTCFADADKKEARALFRERDASNDDSNVIEIEEKQSDKRIDDETTL